MNKPIKLYKITFMRYTNSSADTVKSEDGKEYLDTYKDYTTDKGSIIIKEDEIEKYRKFGGGINEMNFIGIMYI